MAPSKPISAQTDAIYSPVIWSGAPQTALDPELLRYIQGGLIDSHVPLSPAQPAGWLAKLNCQASKGVMLSD